MNLNNLLNQFLGGNTPGGQDSNPNQGGLGSTLGNIGSHIPGGLAGGAAAGGIVALLMGNKSARKMAGKAATYGGAALLGGLAFKAYQNWKDNSSAQAQPAAAPASSATSDADFHQKALADNGAGQAPFELTLIKGMIAAAKADGHIDSQEQARIFEAVERMNLAAEHKAIIFAALQQNISIQELAANTHSIETRSELYLASCLVMQPDHPAERAHLDQLASALQLPGDLAAHLESQAIQAQAAGG